MFEQLDKLGEFLVRQLGVELSRKKKIVSRKTISSLTHHVSQTPSGFELIIFAGDWVKFVEEGVKGAKINRAPRSPFQFKKKKPPFNAILAWAKSRALATGDRKTLGIVYAIQTSIWQRGIEPSFFIKDTLERTQLEINSQIEQAAFKEVEVFVEKETNKFK